MPHDHRTDNDTDVEPDAYCDGGAESDADALVDAAGTVVRTVTVRPVYPGDADYDALAAALDDDPDDFGPEPDADIRRTLGNAIARADDGDPRGVAVPPDVSVVVPVDTFDPDPYL